LRWNNYLLKWNPYKFFGSITKNVVYRRTCIAKSKVLSANIQSASDAIWWEYVTITTVGCGDRYPITKVSRIMGILVMTTGVAVFAMFAGLISSKLLVSPEKEDEAPELPKLEKDQQPHLADSSN
jgi:hypothetical protein